MISDSELDPGRVRRYVERQAHGAADDQRLEAGRSRPAFSLRVRGLANLVGASPNQNQPKITTLDRSFSLISRSQGNPTIPRYAHSFLGRVRTRNSLVCRYELCLAVT